MRQIIILAAALALASITFPASAVPVDLTSNDAWICEGFDLDTAGQIPSQDRVWTKLPAKTGNRAIRIGDIFPRPFSFSRILSNSPDSQYTIKIPFIMYKKDYSSSMQGLFLSVIGNNWAVYLNGKLVKEEIFWDGKKILKDRTIKDGLTELPSELFVNGQNLLTLRIVGDPGDFRTGLFFADGYQIGQYLPLQNLSSDTIHVILLSIFILCGFYNIVLFINKRDKKTYLLFTLSSLAFTVYVFSKSGYALNIFSDTWYILVLRSDSTLIGVTLVACTFELYLKGKISRLLKISSAVMVILAIIMTAGEYQPTIGILAIAAPSFLIGVFSIDILIPYMRLSYDRTKEYRTTMGRIPAFLSSFFLPLVKTLHGNILVAFVIIIASVIVDLWANYMHGVYTMYTVYSFCLLLLGIVFHSAKQYASCQKRSLELYDILSSSVSARSRDLLLSDIALGLYQETLHNLSKPESDSRRTADSVLQLSEDTDYISNLPLLLKAVLMKATEIAQAESGEILLFEEGTRDAFGSASFDYKSITFYEGHNSITSPDGRMIYLPIRNSDEMIGICSLAREERQMPFSDETSQILAKFITMVTIAIRNAIVYQAASKDVKSDRYNRVSTGSEEKVSQAVQYIEDNFTDDISRENLAAHLDINADTLGKAFIKLKGMRISEYINELRLLESARRLTNSDERVIQIAFAVGFESLATFNRLFYKRFRKTPNQFRKSGKAEKE